VPNDVLTIPPIARSCIYYCLGVANVVILALLAFDIGPKDALGAAGAIVAGLSGFFFGVAASNVQAADPPPEPPVVVLPDGAP
jgi:hypothetical protein